MMGSKGALWELTMVMPLDQTRDSVHLSSVKFSHSVVSDSLQLQRLQLARPPCPSPTPGVCLNSHPWSRWCHPTFLSSVVSFSSHLQSFQASGSFPMSQFFPLGGRSIGVSASASVLPMNIQDWFPLGCTGWMSLQSKGLSRVFYNSTVEKHPFSGTQFSLQSNSHILPNSQIPHIPLLECNGFDYLDLYWQGTVSAF